MPPEAHGWNELRDVVGRTMRRLSPQGVPEGWADHVANHLYHGQSEGSPFVGGDPELAKFASPDYWRMLMTAGDPQVDIGDNQHLGALRGDFKDLQGWSGLHWNDDDIKRYQQTTDSRPGAYELSPGARRAFAWQRDREYLESMLARKDNPWDKVFPKGTMLNNVATFGDDWFAKDREHGNINRALTYYNKSKDATHVVDPVTRRSNFQSHALMGQDGINGQGLMHAFRDNAHPLGYFNNNAFAPVQKAVYDTAMEHPVEWFKDPDPSGDDATDEERAARGIQRGFNWVARPIAGFLSNLASLPGHYATAADVYQNGNQAFRASPDIQLPTRGLDSVQQLNRVRGDIEAAQGTMPHDLYHHRNTGEFPTDAGNTFATVTADLFTDPSIMFMGAAAPFMASRGVSQLVSSGVPKSLARRWSYGSVGRALRDEFVEEGAFGGVPGAVMQSMQPKQDMTHDEAVEEENKWWPQQEINHRKAEGHIKNYNMRGGWQPDLGGSRFLEGLAR